MRRVMIGQGVEINVLRRYNMSLCRLMAIDHLPAEDQLLVKIA